MLNRPFIRAGPSGAGLLRVATKILLNDAFREHTALLVMLCGIYRAQLAMAMSHLPNTVKTSFATPVNSGLCYHDLYTTKNRHSFRKQHATPPEEHRDPGC